MKNRKIIGITGQSGAGKTTLTNYLKKNGYSVINADHVARSVVEPGKPCLKELVKMFALEILLPDGELNRKALGKIIFTDSEKRKQVNALMFPYILEEIMCTIKALPSDDDHILFLDAPTLYESGADKMCTVIIFVVAEKEKRIQRIIQRDHISREEAMLRVKAQQDDEFYQSQSDYTIDNGKNKEYLFRQIDDILCKIRSLNND